LKRNYYIFTNSVIKKKQNTLLFENDGKLSGEKEECVFVDLDIADITGELDYSESQGELFVTFKQRVDGTSQRRFIPVETVEAIYAFGEIRFNSRFLNFLSKYRIPMHVFNYYGFYSGSFYPKEYLNSGALFVKQVRHYMVPELRIIIAREFVRSAAFNILKNLRYYCNRGVDLNDEIVELETLTEKIDDSELGSALLGRGGEVVTIALMGVEGNIRQIYYSCWNKILNQNVDFTRRTKQPPDNMTNALISFGNMMLYSACLGEIYRTQLNPLISYLHEPGERRFSLSLDIAEIFKPIIVDRVIFKMINQKMVQDGDFEKKLNYCFMKESAKKAFIREFDEKLKTVIHHRGLGREVSYRRLIRLECYKLIKHLLGDCRYEGFKIWW
jgi:CRISPR-associated protein Cas1